MPRQGFIGSSEVPALFGISPYCTPYQVWAHHARGIPMGPQEDDERMRWGRRFQDDILAETAERKSWEVEPNEGDAFVTHPDPAVRAGATVDAWVRKHERGLGLVEAKNVDLMIWLREWTETEPPAHISLQLQHQLFVTGATWGCISALVGGNTLKLYERSPDPKVFAALQDEVTRFWARVDSGVTPAPDEAADGRNLPALAALYPVPIPNSLLDMRGDAAITDVVRQYAWAAEQRKFHHEIEMAKKAQILATAEHHEHLRCSGWRVKISKEKATRITVKEIEGDPPPTVEPINLMI